MYMYLQNIQINPDVRVQHLESMWWFRRLLREEGDLEDPRGYFISVWSGSAASVHLWGLCHCLACASQWAKARNQHHPEQLTLNGNMKRREVKDTTTTATWSCCFLMPQVSSTWEHPGSEWVVTITVMALEDFWREGLHPVKILYWEASFGQNSVFWAVCSWAVIVPKLYKSCCLARGLASIWSIRLYVDTTVLELCYNPGCLWEWGRKLGCGIQDQASSLFSAKVNKRLISFYGV